MPFAIAEQVHGNLVARVDEPDSLPSPGVDALVTRRAGLCLAIYVADCAAVYLADKEIRAIGLVHAGKKGAELGIVTEAIATMRNEFGSDPANLVMQVAPCIRPPHYEVDFAADIVQQARDAGVRDVFDCGTCTASHPELYYSYRREKGRTGRLLALAAIASDEAGGLSCRGYSV
jgi:copper oxidase (laccase) domain-containing protein